MKANNIIDALSKITKPSVKLNGDIALFLGLVPAGLKRERGRERHNGDVFRSKPGEAYAIWIAPNFTGFVDAALPGSPPGVWVIQSFEDGTWEVHLTLVGDEGRKTFFGTAKLEACARRIVELRALMFLKEDKNEY